MESPQPLIRRPSAPKSRLRRALLASGVLAGGGLLIAAGFGIYRGWRISQYRVPAAERFVPFNAWVSIDATGIVSVAVPHQEMGQGIHTAVALLVAEELDCDPTRILAQPAPLAPAYSNPLPVIDSLALRGGDDAVASVARSALERLLRLGAAQVTGGSTSVRNCWDDARRAGAGARAVLIRAAAQRWAVPADRLQTLSSRVVDPVTGKSFGYGELAGEAAGLDPRRAEPKLRAQYRLLGRGIRRLDSRAKSDGSARFANDVRLPGLRAASVRHAPQLGDSLVSATWLEGQPPAGATLITGEDWFAVVGPTWWQADRWCDVVAARWEAKSSPPAGSETVLKTLRSAAELRTGREVARKVEDSDRPLVVRKQVQAAYEVRFVGHQLMEPMNCTIRLDEDGCEVWIGTQAPDRVRAEVARAVGLPLGRVTVHPCLMGCGLGRRLESDVAIQAARIALQLDRSMPVQLLWRREEDTRRDRFRPASAARFEAGLSGRGEIARMACWLASPSVLSQFVRREFGVPAGWFPDRTCHDGVSDVVYGIQDLRVHHERIDSPIPVGFWRGVGYGVNSFFVESFIDECAHAAGDDPYQFRRRLLQKQPRHLRVVEEVARLSGWGRPVQTRRGSKGGRGIAMVESYGSIVAQTIEVEVEGAEIRVLRVVAVVDCGFAIDRGSVRAQISGAIVGGLSAALHGQVDVVSGSVKQSNFSDLRLLSLRECPRIQVEIIDGGPSIGGIGEVGLPPVAGALGNAVFAATGKRIRSLPMRIS